MTTRFKIKTKIKIIYDDIDNFIVLNLVQFDLIQFQFISIQFDSIRFNSNIIYFILFNYLFVVV
jgi:hypothetical protein